MSEAPRDEYSTLKDELLRMWLPARGVHTVASMLTKNIQKFFPNKGNIDNAPFPWDLICQALLDEDFKCFEGHFESCFDDKPPFQLREAILTGSYSEGLFLYFTEPPDMDFMCVLKNITFTQEDQEHGSLSFREDTPFVNAFVTNEQTEKLWSEFFDDLEKQVGKNRLSSRKLKTKLQENYRKRGSRSIFEVFGKEQVEEITEGAAVTIRKIKSVRSASDILADLCEQLPYQLINHGTPGYNFMAPSSDIVLSIFCEGWPCCAREWITRKRFWPNRNSVENIAQRGFHIVPKSSPDGDFRLSFSCAETMLIETLSSLQHKVIRAFKAVVKYHQDSWSPNLKEILSSYHLKTIAFWYFEKKSQESWSDENAVHHLVALLDQLAEALRTQHLPMYFMPKVNLFQHVDDPEAPLELSEKISQLSRNSAAMSDAVKNKAPLDPNEKGLKMLTCNIL